MAPDEHCIRERGRRIGTQHLERFHAVNAGQLDVHEHQIGDALQGQPDTVLGRAGLHSFVSLGLEDVSHQFHVLLVVFNDQDQAHGWFGMVNVNVEPLPGVLSTRISPPCSSIIRLVRAGRKPVSEKPARRSLVVFGKDNRRAAFRRTVNNLPAGRVGQKQQTKSGRSLY